ncbi:hypothetical protein FRX31_010280 [Thalictrum thalictroides]|uniref:Uncharacterized protein n=1 Tax=Thalictrum thalictroides TaxID=46969 RepID=A0A7J6WRX4_THATH|nr:hypothetical protein FRX31_010280 [Thalictrum thalictroides]
MVENAFDVLAADDEVVKDTFAQEQQQVIRESQQITKEWGLVGEELEPTSAKPKLIKGKLISGAGPASATRSKSSVSYNSNPSQ